VRRLAKQRREDGYASVRDYQTIEIKRATSFTIARGSEQDGRVGKLVFCAHVGADLEAPAIGFGGFVFPEQAIRSTVRLALNGIVMEDSFDLRDAWNRLGIAGEALGDVDIEVSITAPVGVPLSVWGLNIGRISLPDPARAAEPTLNDLRGLAPETYYLPHDVAVPLEIDENDSDKFELGHGRQITLKKCSYCQRVLPIDPNRLGALSFHKHNAKRSTHQNECRACKKWRINDSFNPKRTVDQLNESSLITRERKILLREPEILQEIKDRTGDGLKSQVWKRFGRRCFYCDRVLDLNEVQLDHTRPLAYLWPIDVHATCLCADHNNAKKDKFPVDFYNDEQLRRLSGICGLPYEELVKRNLNEDQLRLILDELPRFAAEWDARTFAATARKIIEIRKDIDLFRILQAMDPVAYEDLMTRLAERPPSVGDDD
jgi:hypothetical protein